MRLRPESLAARLAFQYAGIFVLFFAVAFLFFHLFIGATLREQIDEDLLDDIAELRLLHRSGGLERVVREIQREVAAAEEHELFFRLWDGEGALVFSSAMDHWPGAPLPDPSAMEEEPLFAELHGVGDPHLTRVVNGRIAPDLLVQIGESMEGRHEFMQLLSRVFLLTFLLVSLLSLAVGWFMGRRALRGVAEVSAAVEGMAGGALEQSVAIAGHGREIDQLAAAFNRMAGRIRALVAGMREMTDNIAHDLRSPLARIRSSTEMALGNATTLEEFRQAAADTLEECDRLLQMINTTLDVAEAEAGLFEPDPEPVELAAMLQDAHDLFEPVAQARAIDFSLHAENRVRVSGNRTQLQRMLANLIDNALKYTPTGGNVGLHLEPGEQQVKLVVEDDGPGIPALERSRVFERFYRCDASRSTPGFGLGLSFSRAVARVHGGELRAEERPGGGSRFILTLPRREPGLPDDNVQAREGSG